MTKQPSTSVVVTKLTPVHKLFALEPKVPLDQLKLNGAMPPAETEMFASPSQVDELLGVLTMFKEVMIS